MSPETLLFFRELLGHVQLSASAENFDEQAARISRARKELNAAIEGTLPSSD